MAKNVLRRVVTWADGWLPNRVTPDDIRDSREILDTLAAEMGRDPSSLTISVHGQPADYDLAQRLLEAGADRVIIRPNDGQTEEEMQVELERIARIVLK